MDCLEKLETGGSWAEYGHARHERRHLTQGVPGPEDLMRRLVGGSVSGPQVVGRCASNCWPAPAPTSISNLSRPLARHRFIPRPRNNTEMRPSMPTRNRCAFLNAGLRSRASCSAVFFPPRCGMHTSPTLACWQRSTLLAL